MSLVLAETFLYYTMGEPEVGNKRYAPDTGYTHTLKIFTVQDRREVSSESISVQSSAPINTTYGRLLDSVSLEIPIPDINAYVTDTTPYRVVPHPKNIFMASSILTVNANVNFKEFPISSHWFVESFVLRRNVQRRLYIGLLTLKRWYGALPTA